MSGNLDIREWAEKANSLAESELIEQMPQEFEQLGTILKTQSKNFVSSVETIYTRIQNVNLALKAESVLRKFERGDKILTPQQQQSYNENLAKYKAYSVTNEEFTRFIAQVHQYEAMLNQFLGQSIKTVFVYIDKNGEIVIQELTGDFQEAIKKDTGRSGLAARFNLSNAASFKNIADQLMKSQNLDLTYREINKRADISRKHIRKGTAVYILWKISGTWDGVFVAGGKGDISEAYFAFKINEAEELFQNSMEPNVKTFMTNDSYGVVAVDNIAGMLKGDVTGLNGQQYAIKSQSSGPGGYVETMKLAVRLASSSPAQIAAIMLKEYGKILKKESNKSGRRNKLISSMSKTLDQLVRENIENDIQKRIDVNYII